MMRERRLTTRAQARGLMTSSATAELKAPSRVACSDLLEGNMLISILRVNIVQNEQHIQRLSEIR